MELVDPAGHLLRTFLQLHHRSCSSVFSLWTIQSCTSVFENLVIHWDSKLHTPLSMHTCRGSSLSLCICECVCVHVCVHMFPRGIREDTNLGLGLSQSLLDEGSIQDSLLTFHWKKNTITMIVNLTALFWRQCRLNTNNTVAQSMNYHHSDFIFFCGFQIQRRSSWMRFFGLLGRATKAQTPFRFVHSL